MSTQTHADGHGYTIEWDDDVEAVIHTWTDFVSGQEFRDGAEELLSAIRSRGTDKVLVNTSGIEAHDDADKQWLQEEWIPRAVDAGLEYSAQVHAASVVSQMEMEEFDEQTDAGQLRTYLTDDVDDALEWLADQ